MDKQRWQAMQRVEEEQMRGAKNSLTQSQISNRMTVVFRNAKICFKQVIIS